MDIEKVFNDLESNQTHANEESKKKLVELFTQTKEQWVVHYMLDYYIKTGSSRIMEVLVKAQPPHDSHIFDRIDDWLKSHQYRVQALNIFCFIVRRHPTWLFKIEKHRLIKSIFKLFTHEKDIVPLMSALLGIITLLPIIPNSVPNFLNDLFEVFGHLASWKHQNPNRLPDEKLVHLQLGLQMLFHRLYGMYPCNFMSYLCDFIKKDKGGGIFQHTIKPLLHTVRVHPMLLTSTTETEVSNMRWKEMEPHDVVMECVQLSLPVLQSDTGNDDFAASYLMTPSGVMSGTPSYSRMTSTNSEICVSSTYQSRDLQQTSGSIVYTENCNNSSGQIWSPHNEIAATASAIPLTPTAPFILPLPPSNNTQLLGVTGSSPPEAAVEATPETTPLKDLRELKQQHSIGAAFSNSHAVRAIFASSQPSSPLRKEQVNQFNFPDISTAVDPMSVTTTCSTTTTTATTTVVERRVTTTFDRRLQQVMLDRNNHAQTIEPRANRPEDQRPMLYPSSMPEMNSDGIARDALLTATLCSADVKELPSVCGSCNETDHKMCSAGGLHMPTSRSMHQLAKGIKRRSRMASYCCNDTSYEKSNNGTAKKTASTANGDNKIRRTKSCSALFHAVQYDDIDDVDDETDGMAKRKTNGTATKAAIGETQKTGSRLQRSSKMLAMVPPKAQVTEITQCANVSTQTLEVLPPHYENFLFELLFECKDQRNQHERNLLYPQDILDQYIMRSTKEKESIDAEQYQLMCLQLQYESYRRGIHAERNRRLMGRSRDKHSLEMERDRMRDQLKNYDAKNKDLAHLYARTIKKANTHHAIYKEELTDLKTKYQHELEQNKCLRQANDDLQARLNTEVANRKEINYELESLRGQIFSLTTELQHAQQQADVGLLCKQELARLEAEFIIMGEVQVRCRDRLAEIDNYRARDEELQMLQESTNLELKDLRNSLDEKTSQVDSTKQKISELQTQLSNSEKVITEQKRLLRTVQDEYEERFRSVNKKYDTQKKIIIQMEEKLMMSQQQPQGAVGLTTCSPDTDRTDIASSMERNSPLSTSLASSESLSASLRSTELKNLQQLVETPSIPEGLSTVASGTLHYDDGGRLSTIDMASSASTASAINMMHLHSTATAATELPTTSAYAHAHPHPHLYLQQHAQQPQQQHHHHPHQQQQQQHHSHHHSEQQPQHNSQEQQHQQMRL